MLVMQQYFPQELAIPLEGSDIRPVLLLEFASQPSHLVNILGEAGDPLRAARINGMTIGNTLDYALMLAYGLFTLSFFTGVSRETGAAIWLLFGWAGVVAAISDAVENGIMFTMVRDFAQGTDFHSQLQILPYPVWLKFGLLALTCAGAAWTFLQMRRWALALLCVPAPLLMVPGFTDPFGLASLATATIALGWLAMAIHASSRWYRERGASPGEYQKL